MKGTKKKAVIGIVLIGIIGGGATWYMGREEGKKAVFRTAEVIRGGLVSTIKATGTVEPEEVVDVGAQVAGKINSFGKDKSGKTIDYGSMVEEGTVLAQIDDSLYRAQVAEAKAQVELGKAGVQKAKADLEQMKAKLSQAELDWKRAQKLGASEALSQISYDGYKSAYDIAKANAAVGDAAILQAQASLTQSEATLERAEQNLGYCTIKSPVNGIIIDRRVNIGQTVVSSLNAPSLFLIAKDLKRMQVWVAVNEMDIGRIHTGQAVTFTVDAFSGETFGGEVEKVRLNASMTQNVVTYTTEVTCDNSSGKLLPYLTANVQFEVSRRESVLMVPNLALVWKPSAEQVAPEFRNGRKETAGGAGHGVVWAVAGQYVRPVGVRVGLSDGSNTEVEGKDLTEGLQVVTGVETQTSGPSDVSNPFTPKFPGRGKKGG